MRKYFCDKCGIEMNFDSVHIEYTSDKSIIGREYTFKQLCPKCKNDFIALLNGFIPEFMGNPTTLAPDKGNVTAKSDVSPDKDIPFDLELV